MIGHHVYSDALAPNPYVTGSGRGLRSTRQTLRSLGWKFGVAPLLGSGAIAFQSYWPKTSKIGQFNVLSDRGSLFLLRSNFRWDFFIIGKPHDPAAMRQDFVIVAASSTERCCWMWSKVTSPMIGQRISSYFSVETAKHSLALGYGYHWDVQVLSSTTVQVRRLYVVWFSRYSYFSSFLLINVMLKFSITFIRRNEEK